MWLLLLLLLTLRWGVQNVCLAGSLNVGCSAIGKGWRASTVAIGSGVLDGVQGGEEFWEWSRRAAKAQGIPDWGICSILPCLKYSGSFVNGCRILGARPCRDPGKRCGTRVLSIALPSKQGVIYLGLGEGKLVRFTSLTG